MEGEDDPGPGQPARWNAPTVQASPGPTVAAATDPDPVTRPSVFDPHQPRFDERSELGRGGMGRVVEAVDRVLGRTVAIKHSLATDADNLARFEREVRITARLQHPGIVPILDTGRDDDGKPYYVMRKIDGEPLSARVSACKTVRERLALVPAILAAVDATAYAHAQRVVHRDIKPWNILLGRFGEALLIDWGLARELDGTPDSVAPESLAPDVGLTRAGSAYGTPGFMAPEQARGEQADPRADVYSLGATLFFVLAGTSPFAGVQPTEVIERVAAGVRADLAAIPPEVPAELTAIVAKALAPDRAARYGDAGELAADLRRFLAGQLVAAHHYTARERIARWVRKHRLVTIVAAAALAVIAAGAIISVRRVVAERDQARAARRLAESRSEEMLVDRARSLVAVDPTSAIALLRGLPATSPQWPAAREVARAALAGGVERLIARHDRFVGALAFSPHGRLASGSIHGVQLHDLDHATTRILSTHTTTGLGWLDDHRLVRLHEASGAASELELIDADTGRATMLATGFVHAVFSGARVVIRTEDGAVREFGVDGQPVVIATAGIDAIDASAGRLALLTRDHATVIDADGTRRELPVSIAMRIFAVKLAPDGDRIAALIFKGVAEWSMSSAFAPRQWPRTADALNGIAFVDDALYGWSNDGSGVVTFEPDRIMPRWMVTPKWGEPVKVAAFRDGAFFATLDGQLASAGASGLIQIAHRPLELTAAAADATGRRLAIGTGEGEVILLDLTAARPITTEVEPGTRLYAVAEHRAIVGVEAGTLYSGGSPVIPTIDALAILDPVTGSRTELAALGSTTTVDVEGTTVVAWGGMPDRTLAILDVAGRERYRATGLRSVAVGPGLSPGTTSAFSFTVAGDIVEVPIADPQRSRVVARFPPRAVADHEIAIVVAIEPTDGGLVVSRLADPGESGPDTHTFLVDRTGTHPLALGIRGEATAIAHTADGAWWSVEDYEKLWRLPAGGRAIEVPLGQRIKWVGIRGGQLWARSDSTLFELAPDGHVIRTTSGVGSVAWLDAGILSTSASGVEVVAAEANVRRMLRLAATPSAASATADGRTVAALIGTSEHPALAMWVDPVPVDPAAVPAYLAQVTNARLDAGSDAVTWDAVRTDPPR